MSSCIKSGAVNFGADEKVWRSDFLELRCLRCWKPVRMSVGLEVVVVSLLWGRVVLTG